MKPYYDFAKTLQKEIEEDCGVEFKGKIKNKRQRTAIKYRKGFEADPKFLGIWEQLKKKTTYQVDYNTQDLIVSASKAIKDLPEIKAPSIRSTKVKIDMRKKQFKQCMQVTKLNLTEVILGKSLMFWVIFKVKQNR